MATEFTSSYWSSEWTTDRARRRADELLDTLAKRALISRNTSGFHWDADEDADLAEFLLSMACPPVDPIRTLHHLSTAEPAAFLVWKETMSHVVAELNTERMKTAAEILLTQRLDLMVQALLTPETMWPQEAQGSGLQHIVLSWPTARTLLDTAFAACDPREVLLFLPRLAELLSRAASYVHTATVHAAITYLPASPEDPQATPAAEEAQAGGDAQTAAAAGERVSMSEVTQGKRVFDEVAEHLLALSVRALGRLKRRNAAHVGDVLVFAGRATMAYNFQREPPRDHPATLLLDHFQPLQPAAPGSFATSLLQAVCSAAWLWLQAPREAVEDGVETPALAQVRACATCSVLRTAPQRCGRCLQEFYCSRQCQKKRWPDHKTSCAPVDTGSAVAADDAAPAWPATAPEARQKVLSAMLRALEPLGHTPALDAHLRLATPAVLCDVARTLRVLGLQGYCTADWTALVPVEEPASESSDGEGREGSEGQGSDTESEGGEREMRARSIAAGAAVGLAAHLLLRLRHPAGDCVAGDAPGSVPYDWLESPYATVQAACITCMPLLNTAQELQSTSGMLNAFQALQNAARVALPQPAGRPWVVGAAAEGAAAERAQQAMCAAAVAVAKVALVAMTVATEERVRVAARNAIQELARVMPAVECAAMLERFISTVDAPGVQSQLMYVVLKRMQARDDGDVAVDGVHADGAERDDGPPPPAGQASLWESFQMAEVVLAPLFRVIKLTKSKKFGVLETRDAMPLGKAQHVVLQSDLLVATINILIFQLLRGKRGSLPAGFAQCVTAWLAQHQQVTDEGARPPVRCLLERAAAAKTALELSGNSEEALAMQLIDCSASRLLELMSDA